MSQDQSKVYPTAMSLDDVNISYLGMGPDCHYLKCGGCGMVYDVKVGETDTVNWYACPSPKHSRKDKSNRKV